MPRVTEAELETAGRALAATLPAGAVVWLSGPLGAGKTTVARALLRSLGAAGAPASPTYDLVHRHETPNGPVYHVDCYRLRTPEEAAAIDWGELATAAAVVIEWPERAGGWAPAPDHWWRLGHTEDPGVRTLEQA